MSKPRPIFYSALLLTCVNLLLRLVGTGFQVYLSSAIGAAGIGLVQLTLSVGNLAMVAGTGGIRTAAMYLTAEELGKGRRGTVSSVLSGCFVYSLMFSVTVSLSLGIFAPQIAEHWIGDIRTVSSLRLFAAFLPCSCLCGVMTGYFTAANRIGTLAAVEVCEQLLSICATLAALTLWAGSDPGKACLSVILGSSLGTCLTLLCLVALRLREHPPSGPAIPVAQRLRSTALPLAVADDLRTGISTLENLMVPRRLSLNISVADPLAAFGIVSGMVFPVLMFPACFLFGLAELLIPELARCAAGGRKCRIGYLVRRCLKAALLYGVLFCGWMYLSAGELCNKLYQNSEAGIYLRQYSLLIPILYCDAITDAMIKGLGQQKISVRFNIITNILDVALLFLLLPKYGMQGYFLSFALTHLINFALSLNLLLSITGIATPWHIPAVTMAVALGAVWAVSKLEHWQTQLLLYPLILFCGLYLSGILRQADIRWFKGLAVKK